MKCIVFFILAIIGIALSTSTKTKSVTSTEIKNKLKSKTENQLTNQIKVKASLLSKNLSQKTKSIVEFMNEINGKPKKKKNNKKKKIKKITIKRKKFKDQLKVLLSSWLKVSTPNFRKNSRFPTLTIPYDKKISIVNNKYFFRINTDYSKSIKSDAFSPPSQFDFFFRLSGKNLYYSTNKNSINILGVINVRHIIDADAKDDFSQHSNCFKVNDRTNTNWLLCAANPDLRDKWVCKIKDILGLDTRDCRVTKLDNIKEGITYKDIIKPIIYIPLASKECNENWNYALKGIDWNCLCAEGKQQSPINLPPPEKSIDSKVKPLFQYEEININDDKDDTNTNKVPLKLVYEDWALRMKHESFGRLVTLDGAIYSANEIIFHTPSDHKIDGKIYDMEMQIIHKGQTEGDIGKQVILSFLFEKRAGPHNKFIDDIDFFDLPNPLNNVKELHKSFFINNLFYEVEDNEFPSLKPFSFYTYQGSLTQPPCVENTIVYVASKPIHIGSTALLMFQEVSRIPDQISSNGNVHVSSFNPQNNRKIQPLNGRSVFHYNHQKYCGPDINPSLNKVKEVGHYEKIIQKKIDYFFVNGLNPSGLPGAYVVTDKEAKRRK